MAVRSADMLRERHEMLAGDLTVDLTAAPPSRARRGALPVMAKRVIRGPLPSPRRWRAPRMTGRRAREFPGRQVRVTADSAYAGKELGKLPASVTWTTRLRATAALYALPPARAGRRSAARRCAPTRRPPGG